jgi:hypothetical protein
MALLSGRDPLHLMVDLGAGLDAEERSFASAGDRTSVVQYVVRHKHRIVYVISATNYKSIFKELLQNS